MPLEGRQGLYPEHVRPITGNLMVSPATTYDAATARDQLPELLRRVAAGEEIILTDAGAPPVRLVAVEPPEPRPSKRVGGQLAGQGFWIADDFNAPLPPDLLEAFEGGTEASTETE